MKKTIIILFFAIIFVQNMFAWGGAFRDVAKQPSATPTFYLGDDATFAWAISSGVTLVKIGVGILASPPDAYSKLTWNTPTNYTYTGWSGKMYNYTVTSVGTGYYSIWLGYNATTVGTNGSFFNGKNLTMTYGDNNNSSGTSSVPWNSTYCYGTFTVSAINDPTVTTPFTTTSSTVSLAWSKNAKGNNVMIVQYAHGATPTAPTNGTSYSSSNAIGTGTVVYNGSDIETTSSSLNSSTAYDYYFYSVNNNYYSSGVLATATTTSGSTATDYFRSQTTGNWSNTATWQSSSDNTNWITATLVPSSSSTTVTILDGHIVSIDENVTVNSLILNSGSTLTINAGKQLTVNSTLSNSGTLNLLSDGTGTATIKTPATISGSGTANVSQNFSSYRTWYMSSPVADAQPTGMNRIKYYNEANNSWPTLFDARTETAVPYGTNKFEIGKGYQVVPDNDDTGIQFSGVLNTGNIPVTLTRSAETNTVKQGFNLIGNPYPSYLDWNAVYSANSNELESSTMWYRTKTGGSYYFWTVNGDGVSCPNGASNSIPPMQAFWVRTKTGGGTLQLTNAMRSHAPGSDYLLKAPAARNTELQLLRLQVSNGTNTDEAVLYFSPNATNGLDVFDSPKMSNENTTIPEIFTRAGNEQLVINAMNTIPIDTEIPLGFVAGSSSAFSIKANELSNLPSNIRVILKDNITNTVTNLTDGSTAYEFTPATTSTDRFSIIFRSAGTTTGLENPKNENILAYCNTKGQVTISYKATNSNSPTAYIFNAIGQCLTCQILTSNITVIDKALIPGVYVVRVNNVTRKVVVE